MGRLEHVSEPDGKETEFAYDAAGNRLTETVTVDNSNTITEYSYTDHGRLINAVETSDSGEKTTVYYYDNNGSQISKLVSTISDPDGGAEVGFLYS